MPHLTDAVKEVRPDVERARMAFLECVDRVTDGELFPTHYYDRVLMGAVMSTVKRVDDASAAADVGQLADHYYAFVDALEPFQPDHPRVAGDERAVSDLAKGCVFYLLPSLGGYWVEGSANMRRKVEPIVNALLFLAARGP